jgi:hypothetical protein
MVAMKFPRWLPHPLSWASALALYLFAMGVTLAMAVVLPPLFELLQRSPRLAWAGILGVFCAPIPAAATVHAVAHAVLDLGDAKKAARPKGADLWAGFVAWATILFVNVATVLVMLVLDPPPVDPDGFFGAALRVAGPSPGVHTFVWILLAAKVYELQRRGTADHAHS